MSEQQMGSKHPGGRPRRLNEDGELELFFFHEVGNLKLKTCAAMLRVSHPTAKRIVRRVRERYGERAEQMAREFRSRLLALRDST